ncbi:GH3 family domain-containing protein [Haloferula sp.]|uniref:GH3 family domain-containing protein n=1 Tax=Haloferula sp. TaxID=2497595 RepID=UPI003C7883F8
MHEGRTLLNRLAKYPLPEHLDPVARYVRPNENTAFGREHTFASVRSYGDFVQAVPLHDYDDLKPWIERSHAGESEVLTAESPIGFELTSGSSSGAKAIPVTPGFQREMAMALGSWMASWRARWPEVFEGPAYWSVSPRLGEGRRTPGGLPLGFESDGAYFPGDIAEALGSWLVTPDIENGELFSATAKALLDCPELRSVSVWSPTFLLRIDEALPGNATWAERWPELRVVSCWADAQAAMWTGRLRECLGESVVLEPKGLLATEGVSTIPKGRGARLAKGVHLHEFLDLEDGNCHREPAPGRPFEVILTTAAGLYRYRTGDLVEIDGDGIVRFLGRRGGVSDLVGEKLSPSEVTAAFRNTNKSGFVRVQHDRCRYEVWSTDAHGKVIDQLKKNPHLRAAVSNGQLQVEAGGLLPDNWESEASALLARKRGSREGDVKLPVIEHGELSGLWQS